MKFITEDDLRYLYKREPFAEYKIEQGTKITPGARQFLVDRGIIIFHNTSKKNKNTVKEENSNLLEEKRKKLKILKLSNKIKTMEALFLIVAEELLSKDVILAQKIINLSKNFSNIKIIMDMKSSLQKLYCQECTGMNANNFSNDLEDCFEITEFHMQLAKGKEILSLHRLRCALHEIELDVLEFYDDSEKENRLNEEILGLINQITNTLSQMICSAIGGKECQRKN